MNVPQKIIIHHSASDRYSTSVQKIDHWHKERGFTYSKLGYYVGYQYVIDMYGEITQTRSESEEGCHTIGENNNSIGICLIGNFDKDVPTLKQVTALRALIQNLMTKYKIKVQYIYPHRRFSNTHCPGVRLNDDWAQREILQAEVSRLTQIVLWLQIQISKILK